MVNSSRLRSVEWWWWWLLSKERQVHHGSTRWPLRQRRRRSKCVRLGRKGQCIGFRVRPQCVLARWWSLVVLLRRLKSAFLLHVASGGVSVGSYYWAFPFIYPLPFPL
ncbi:hypothetical protein AMTRI_Chr06g174150 [Amborella trichopoda]